MDSSTGNDNNTVSKCAACNNVSDSLKKCGGCNQVSYCNSFCQRSHWSKHKKECRQLVAKALSGDDNYSISRINLTIKRDEMIMLYCIIGQMVLLYENEEFMSTLNDEDDKLWENTTPLREDCPICFLPMPVSGAASGVTFSYQPCCGKMLCEGCIMAAEDEMYKGNMKECCPFCRLPNAGINSEYFKRCKERMKLKDAAAFYRVGYAYSKGEWGLEYDMQKALELWNQAIEIEESSNARGWISTTCRCEIASTYYHGKSVEKDLGLAVHNWKLAAIDGHELARHNLGKIEKDVGNTYRAMKHCMIAASAGYDASIRALGEGYKQGHVTKEEYAKTLREYQDSRNEMESEQRTKATAGARNKRCMKEFLRKAMSNNPDDGLLFQDPPPKEDCPICFLPMPHSIVGIGGVDGIFHSCCGKRVCSGCMAAVQDKTCCLFCRKEAATSNEDHIKRTELRMKAGDAEAFNMLANQYATGGSGLSIDKDKAFELYNQATTLGSINAHYSIGCMYLSDEIVATYSSKKDEENALQMAFHHISIAAVGGHEVARNNLGAMEASVGNMDRAYKHFMMAARCGMDSSLKMVGKGYKDGHVTKGEYAATLRAYQDSINEMKSEQRTKAEGRF